MESFKVVVYGSMAAADPTELRSDLAAVEELVHQIGEDVDDLSAQLRELREELQKRRL
jgi:hypothetical protein